MIVEADVLDPENGPSDSGHLRDQRPNFDTGPVVATRGARGGTQGETP